MCSYWRRNGLDDRHNTLGELPPKPKGRREKEQEAEWVMCAHGGGDVFIGSHSLQWNTLPSGYEVQNALRIDNRFSLAIRQPPVMPLKWGSGRIRHSLIGQLSGIPAGSTLIKTRQEIWKPANTHEDKACRLPPSLRQQFLGKFRNAVVSCLGRVRPSFSGGQWILPITFACVRTLSWSMAWGEIFPVSTVDGLSKWVILLLPHENSIMDWGVSMAFYEGKNLILRFSL